MRMYSGRVMRTRFTRLACSPCAERGKEKRQRSHGHDMLRKMTKSVSVGPLAVSEQTLPPYQNNHMRDACLLPIPASSKLELFIYFFSISTSPSTKVKMQNQMSPPKFLQPSPRPGPMAHSLFLLFVLATSFSARRQVFLPQVNAFAFRQLKLIGSNSWHRNMKYFSITKCCVKPGDFI